MRNSIKYIVCATLLSVICATVLSAQNYRPDETFGQEGGHAVYNGVISNAVFKSILLLPDGKILAAGHTIVNNFDDYRYGIICRFKANGIIDSSFGENGTFQASWERFYDIGIADNGNVFFCGDEIFNGPGNVPVQIAITGFTDGTDHERTSLSLGYPSSFFKLNLLPSGKIVCAGKYTDATPEEKCVLAQYNMNNLYMDNAFGGGDGLVKSSDGNPAGWLDGKSTFYGMDIAPNGKIIAVGAHASPGDNTADVFYSRWNADGSPDNTFYSNTYNIATWNYGNNEATAFDVRLDNDGNLCIAGFSNSSTSVTGTATWLAGDFNATADCYVNAPYTVFNAVERHDGGMIFGGCTGDNASNTQMVISRLKSNNEIDSDFGNDELGNLLIPKIPESTSETITAMAVDNNNNIYAAGQSLTNGVSYPIIVKLEKVDPNAIYQPGRSMIKIFPNPASHFLNILFNWPLSKNAQLAVWNVQGQKLNCARKITSSSSVTIDMSALTPGIYFIRYADGEKTGWEKVIKE